MQLSANNNTFDYSSSIITDDTNEVITSEEFQLAPPNNLPDSPPKKEKQTLVDDHKDEISAMYQVNYLYNS
jgi:UDP-N-acetylenolpyruvoylglucosamine reductase